MKALPRTPAASPTWRDLRPVVRAYRDRSNRHHFALSHDGDDGLRWLSERQLWLLDGGTLEPGTPSHLLGCLLLFDGVVAVADLERAWSALGGVYRAGNALCCDWLEADGRQQRRCLSVFTALSLHAQEFRQGSFDEAQRQLMQAMRASPPPGTSTDFAALASLGSIVEHVQAALMSLLPGDLFAHIKRTQLLTALPRSALARRESKLALAPMTGAEDPQFGGATDEHALELLDAVDSNAADISANVVRQITVDCREATAVGPNHQRQREEVLKRLRSRIPQCKAAGPRASLLLYAVMEVVQHGTGYRDHLAPSSIDEYFRHALLALWSRLRNWPLDEPASIDWSALYAAVLIDPVIEPLQRPKVAAALGAMHRVFEAVIGVPALNAGLSPEVPTTAAAANLVWPHEVALAAAWLAPAADISRLHAQAGAVLNLLSDACMRIDDVWHIHCYCIRIDGERVVIDIDPLPQAGRGKSTAARRQVVISRHDRCNAIRRWYERRQEEGALPRDLLFGDPANGRCAWRKGATNGLLNALLKAASGDPTIGSHELRHASASLARAEMGDFDQRKLESLSAQAGHEWTSTTLATYTHLYPELLRAGLNKPLMKLSLTEAMVCRVTGSKAGWLRKRWQRRRGRETEQTWQALLDAADRLSFPSVTEGLRLHSPKNPLRTEDRPLTYATTLAVLGDLALGFSPHVVQLRQGVGQTQLECVLDQVRAFSNASGSRQRGRSPGATTVPQMPFVAGWRRTDQVKWRGARAALQRAAPEILRDACGSWSELARDGCIELTDLAAALPLLRWLASAGLQGQQVVLCLDRTGEEAAMQLAKDVAAVFGAAPQTRLLQPRRGRPRCYMQIATMRGDTCTSSNAGLSVAGLNALMFCAWVWLAMTAEGPTNV